ncbi:aspartate-semialdehyde dehydrogenase [Candidatus Methylacidithermus pantelleriae]|uniref:Aspartate-semialdehyde dehydrogenase n=1 Tax=Candidatus Methylacidithermus pantelleriae TaxID=2744239 RepID=A0A8J2BIA5_9BACT|nr:aspartate-semialdehyde dehydrogenase [Candidatus Methylacidithermus pantelleriae]CAF0697213.1 Aspartate-semialdehyde dehydrogenase [Candidatus Methylacidithermus pantelleriae]
MPEISRQRCGPAGIGELALKLSLSGVAKGVPLKLVQSFRVAIVGATGAVGREMIRLLELRHFPLKELRLFASENSRGRRISVGSQELEVRTVSPGAFEGIDFALFSAGRERSLLYVPEAIRSGAVVIDNSSAYRYDPSVPLVVPEVNPGDLAHHPAIVANPNCTTALLSVVLWPLHLQARIRRVIVATYQAASGAGARGLEELHRQVRAYVRGLPVVRQVFRHPIAFNVFSHDSPIGPDGFNEEENKVARELRKIFHEPDLGVCATCVRVPVFRAHCEAVVVETEEKLSAEEARKLLSQAPGVRVVDDRESNTFPMPVDAAGRLEVLVGRIREDPSHPHGLAFFLAGDQLLKGAAWNAIQILEHLSGARCEG